MKEKIIFPNQPQAHLFRLVLAGVLALTIGITSAGQTLSVAAAGQTKAGTDNGAVNMILPPAAPATNDEFPGTTFLTVPYENLNVDTTGATTDTDPSGDGFIDPTSIIFGDCNSNQGEASVWYRYTNTTLTDINLSVDSIGSNYDTLISVWQGDPTSLTLVACSDDISLYDIQSELRFLAQAGTTYYIEVIDYAGPAPSAQAGPGGSLSFHVNEYIPPVLEPPSDFDGDLATDLAVFRPSTGGWYVRDQFVLGYGTAGDVPVSGDYDGDGDADVAVFRNGAWFVKDQFVAGYGIAGDIPVQGDYDGDGDTDVAVFRHSTGGWYVKDLFVLGYGIAGDIPVPGDYDGDGDTDIAVFRNGAWFVKDQFVVGYGIAGDIPVPGDYDADGDTDVAVFRPSTGGWYVKDQFVLGWGTAGDFPVPGDYDGDKDADVAVFRNGVWFVKDQFVAGYGIGGDIPLAGQDTNGDGDPYQ